jgi:ubiquinone/menaquinone biosynthesis C-methylase UbiE
MERSLPRRLYDASWGRAFALGYDWFLSTSEKAGLREKRAELVRRAHGRTLEIGAGTGLNLDHYSDAVTELVLAEPFAPMAAKLRARIERAGAGDGRPIEVIDAPAERLPLPDDDFDTVVSTLVLCTVDDPAQAVAEVGRVLRPGGSFVYLEHVRSPDPRLARWQDRLHRPWWVFGHGCNCNRDTVATIAASGLEPDAVERDRMPKAPPIVRPLAIGSARPPR